MFEKVFIPSQLLRFQFFSRRIVSLIKLSVHKTIILFSKSKSNTKFWLAPWNLLDKNNRKGLALDVLIWLYSRTRVLILNIYHSPPPMPRQLGETVINFRTNRECPYFDIHAPPFYPFPMYCGIYWACRRCVGKAFTAYRKLSQARRSTLPVLPLTCRDNWTRVFIVTPATNRRWVVSYTSGPQQVSDRWGTLDIHCAEFDSHSDDKHIQRL
jgi:hypothetical protein